MSNDEPSFNADEATRTQKAMREAIGLGPEQFPMPAFVGMVSDEIEQLRAKGKTDADIAALIASTSGKLVTAEHITRYYATPEQRGNFGEER